MKKLIFSFLIIFSLSISFGQKIDSMIDSRDGKVYKIVKIGNQTWFAQNLAYKADSGCWAYADSEKYVAKYGYLYTFSSAKKYCPAGWHIPNNAEWTALISFCGGDSVAGGQLKSKSGWKEPNIGANDSFSFSALPGGYHHTGDTVEFRPASKCFSERKIHFESFNGQGEFACWWCSSVDDTGYLINIFIDFYNNRIIKYHSNVNGFSVRCIKD